MAIPARCRRLALLGGLLLARLATAAAPEPVIQAVAFGLVADAPADAAAPDDPSPFFAASDAVGLPEELAVQVSDLFAEAIDFHRDLERGYLCTLVYEMHYPDGMPRPGRILAARFVTPEQHLEAFLFRDGGGTPAYFDPRGLDVNKTPRLADPEQEPWLKALPAGSLEAAFRRSPLEFSRITSRPAVLRYHPILKLWRAHRGTDYGAPAGTRVRATADGTVAYLGKRGGYGRLVELRHFGRYTSRYGHLSAYADGLAVGGAVAKGQVIGLVGQSGLATGPHLHYELQADTGASPPDRLSFAIRAITPADEAAFQAAMAEQRQRFAYANRANRYLLHWPQRQ